MSQKRRKNNTEEHESQVYERPVKDKRVIDLTKPLPSYIPWPSEPLHMTLCAGDGLQLHNGELKTDIEYFTKRIEGFNRETKSTNIFCCSPYYNPGGLLKNIEYLNEHRELKILLVLCDTTNKEHLDRFSSLFSNKLTVIQEDMACYGGALSYDILNHVLVPGGKYILDDAQKIHNYPNSDARFDYNKRSNIKLVITKKMTTAATIAGTKTTSKKRNNRRKSRRKLK
jgi:hypothetical protein